MAAEAAPALTIGQGIRDAAARFPGRAALVDGTDILTYRELVGRMARLAHATEALFSIKSGDRVALIAPNSWRYVEVVAGLSDLGAIVATLSPRLTAGELTEIIADCDPALIIIDPALPTAHQLDWSRECPILVLDDRYEALLASASDIPLRRSIDPTAPFALAYTSGTTGKPKGVLLPHRSRALTFRAMAEVYGCFGPQDNFLAMAPMCHGAGFVFACAGLFFGATTTLFGGGDPEAMLERIAKCDISGVFVVPTQLTRLFDLPQSALDKARTHNLRSIISNAAALAQPLKEQAVDLFGSGLLNESYGSTEGGIVTNISPDDILARSGSVGLPFPYVEIELRRADGSRTDPDEPGELYSRSPTSFAGYWRRPEATAETLVDGWVTVGDIAVADAEGYITIVDRKKDMVVSGGLNIYPREVENVIAALDGVREVAVIGRPDREWGEVLTAYIVRRKGAMLAPEAVIATCRQQLASYKVPRDITFIGELPRNVGGKVLKSVLRKQAE
jgi:acyl-CoA synthetase (AMP-forming)/AMP-acid ligase II